MTAITRLSDNEGCKRPVFARLYAVRNEADEAKALEEYTSRYDRVPETVYVWRGNAYIELREGEK